MKYNNKDYIVKANRLIQNFYLATENKNNNSSLQLMKELEIDIFDYLICQIQSPMFNKEFNEIHFSVQHFIKSSNTTKDLERVIQALNNLSTYTGYGIYTKGRHAGKEGTIRLVQSVIKEKELGYGQFTVILDEQLQPFLLSLDSNNPYTKIERQIKKNLKSKYSKILYELCKSYQQTIYSRKFTLDEFKEYLVIPNSYKFNDIKRRILEDSINEINEKTDINVKYKTDAIPGTKKVGYIKFKITSKSTEDFIDAEYEIKDDFLEKRFIMYFIRSELFTSDQLDEIKIKAVPLYIKASDDTNWRIIEKHINHVIEALKKTDLNQFKINYLKKSLATFISELSKIQSQKKSSGEIDDEKDYDWFFEDGWPSLNSNKLSEKEDEQITIENDASFSLAEAEELLSELKKEV